MSLVGSEDWTLYLGVGGSGLFRAGQAAVWQPHLDAQEGIGAFLGRLAGTGRWRRRRRPAIRVWLSGAIARPFVLELPHGLKNVGEAELLAQARAAEATGHEGRCAVWLSEAAPGAMSLAVAVPHSVLDGLVLAAKQYRIRVRSIRPWWTHALADALRQHPGLGLCAVRDSEALTLISARGDAWLSANAYVPEPPSQASEALVSRHLVGSGLASDLVCRVQWGRTGTDATSWPAVRVVPSFDSA